MEKSLQLAQILRRVQQGEDPMKIRYEARELLATVRLSDVTAAEKYLLESGISFDQLRNLVYSFASILGDQFALLRANLPGSHIIRAILAEHEMFECFLADLKEVNDKIQAMQEMNQYCSEYRKLCHIGRHLYATNIHNQREDDMIFPALKKQSCHSLCKSLKRTHSRIASAINNFTGLICNFTAMDFDEFKLQLNAFAMYLVPTVREHIFQEDNILYPIALEALSAEIWDSIKELCDETEYCAFDGADV
ncbi:MAG: DUF438 domain-containing protein [Planctomycetes bacterium]|nr:DUF438 domain-containing protein [Planctomycetota bacterium]